MGFRNCWGGSKQHAQVPGPWRRGAGARASAQRSQEPSQKPQNRPLAQSLLLAPLTLTALRVLTKENYQASKGPDVLSSSETRAPLKLRKPCKPLLKPQAQKRPTAQGLEGRRLAFVEVTPILHLREGGRKDPKKPEPPLWPGCCVIFMPSEESENSTQYVRLLWVLYSGYSPTPGAQEGA